MTVVDAHTHLLAPAWVPTGVRRAWARQAAARRHPAPDPEQILPRVLVGQSDPDGGLTTAALAHAGVDRAVVPVVDWTLAPGADCDHAAGDLPIEEVNALTAAACAASDGVLYHCAGVDPRHPQAHDIAAQALAAPTAVGFKLYPANGWHADDPAHDWVYRLLLEQGRAALVHTSPLGGEPLQTPLSRPAALAPVLARHPDLTLVMAHAGFEAWWQEALDVATGWTGAYLELSLWQELADRDHAEFRARMRLIVGRLGAHRVLFASDTLRGPATDPDGTALRRWVDQFAALAESYAGSSPVLSPEELELAMGLNATRIYHLGA